MNKLSIGLVAYRNDRDELQKLLDSIKTLSVPYTFYVCDNSPDESLRPFFESQGAVYLYPNANLGFGIGHNVIIKEALKEEFEHHLVINPDVYFSPGNIEKMIEYSNQNPDVGMIGPEIRWPNGKLQHEARRLPRPYDIFIRRMLPRSWVQKRLDYYEMQDMDYSKPLVCGFVSDACSLYKMKALVDVGLYAEDFFLYYEEIDMGLRLAKIGYKVVYFPYAKVTHGLRAAHRKSWKMMKIGIEAGIIYFNKHGWWPLW